MKRTAEQLKQHLNGSCLDKDYLLEVTEALYDLTVKDFYKGRPDAGDYPDHIYRSIPAETRAGGLTFDNFMKMKVGNALLLAAEDDSTGLTSRSHLSLVMISYESYLFMPGIVMNKR